MMNEEELQIKILQSAVCNKQPEEFLTRAKQYQYYMMLYNCAIREVQTKLEILNDELNITNGRSPIEVIKSRVKKTESIINKFQRKHIEISIDNLNRLKDIAGIRVICSFIDDIYTISNMLTRQDDIRLLELKDYIQEPKANGYRSLHIIIEIPVFFSEEKHWVPVEIQIRTIAMDFWASLEHQLKYKKNVVNQEEVSMELSECARVIAETDKRMQEIRNKIYY